MSAHVAEATAPPALDVHATLPYAIDPEGCACDRCESGTHIPLQNATRVERLAMLFGMVVDRTGLSFLELCAWERENDPEQETDEHDS